jgi:PAS domain S-box-containing protein
MGSMSAVAQSVTRPALDEAYPAALQDYVSGAGEAALTRAYELGRKAQSQGVGVLDLALLHHEALMRLSGGRAGDNAAIGLAAQFLAESLSPFEMTLRAYQANARLLGLSETLARQNTEIDLAREQLRTILDATTAVIYLKDAEGRYLFVNREFQKVFARASDEVVGRTDEEALPAAVAAIFQAHDRGVMAAAKPREMEESIPEGDGIHTYISLKVPLLDAGGVPHAICCVATDITERKRADDALRQAKEALESANRDLESFSYSVAHDLRAPLRSIDGFSQIVLEDHGEAVGPDGRKYLERVRALAQHMAELIDDLLGLARVSRSELKRARVDLSAVARRIVERLRTTEPHRQVEVALQDGVLGHGDPGLLGAVLDNLLGNAWKFTKRHTHARIEFGTAQQDGKRVYFVHDDGAGFDMAYANKLFGPFQRLHTASEFEGTGIGLATVQRIIRRHRGWVWAKGELDRGATFYFTLPTE